MDHAAPATILQSATERLSVAVAQYLDTAVTGILNAAQETVTRALVRVLFLVLPRTGLVDLVGAVSHVVMPTLGLVVRSMGAVVMALTTVVPETATREIVRPTMEDCLLTESVGRSSQGTRLARELTLGTVAALAVSVEVLIITVRVQIAIRSHVHPRCV